MTNDTLILHIISPFLDTFLNREVYFPVLSPAMLSPFSKTTPLKTTLIHLIFFNAITKKISAGKSS